MFTRKIINTITYELENYTQPILILGARQIGKTTVAKQIGKQSGNYIYLNLEADLVANSIFDGNLYIDDLITSLEIQSNSKIDKDTLIILDEIQSNPRAITSLKYFQEDGRYKVLATGSNLGVAMFTSTSSFPVGKVKQFEMYQLSFEEFLQATGNNLLADKLKGYLDLSPIPNSIHEKLLELFDLYIELGGYPEVISNYISHSLIEAIETRRKLHEAYKTDLSKYVDPEITSRLQNIYSNIVPMLSSANQKYKLTTIDRSGFRSLSYPLHWLVSSNMVHQVFRVESATHPLAAHASPNNFKLIHNDTGLLLSDSGYTVRDLLKGNEQIYFGLVIETYIGQTLAKHSRKLYYYHKNTTEIDYLIELGSKVIPIEVKSGNNTKAKSLSVYKQRNNPEFMIKTSRKNCGYSDNLKNVPLYLFDTYIENLITEHFKQMYS